MRRGQRRALAKGLKKLHGRVARDDGKNATASSKPSVLARDGADLLRSNQAGWSAQQFWETYIQLTVVEKAFRVLKSELLLRPIWHPISSRA